MEGSGECAASSPVALYPPARDGELDRWAEPSAAEGIDDIVKVPDGVVVAVPSTRREYLYTVDLMKLSHLLPRCSSSGDNHGGPTPHLHRPWQRLALGRV